MQTVWFWLEGLLFELYSTFMNEQTTSIDETELKRLASLIADRLNDWLLDNHYDLIHEVCDEVVVAEYPNLDEEDYWELLPEVFDRIVPFTSI